LSFRALARCALLRCLRTTRAALSGRYLLGGRGPADVRRPARPREAPLRADLGGQVRRARAREDGSAGRDRARACACTTRALPTTPAGVGDRRRALAGAPAAR